MPDLYDSLKGVLVCFYLYVYDCFIGSPRGSVDCLHRCVHAQSGHALK